MAASDRRLDVDTSTPATSKLPVNIDMYMPSLPCNEIIATFVDDSGAQQLAVTDTLQKLRVDRNGVPIDIPRDVDWNHAVAPGFQQRKLISLMEEAQDHLSETLGHIEHEVEENPDLSPDEHETHKLQLSQQAALLEGRLERLVQAADPTAAEAAEGGEDAATVHLELTASELQRMHDEVESTRVYSSTQREQVLANLHAMSRNVERLRNGTTSGATAENLREALRIRLSILNDNVQGFVSADDIDRKDRYGSIEALLDDVVANGTASLAPETAEHVHTTVSEMRAALGELLHKGRTGAARQTAEASLKRLLVDLRADLRGESQLPDGYCGSCYGASPDPSRCCNTCDDIRAAYRERRWGFPEEARFEQCQRDARLRHARQEDGEGCNLFGTIEVARVTGSFNVAPASSVRARGSGRQAISQEEASHFNVTHHIRRLSFGTDFPGQRNPLDDVWTYSPGGPGIARYFLKVVPTTFEFLDGRTVKTNQFSVTQYYKATGASSTLTNVLPRRA